MPNEAYQPPIPWKHFPTPKFVFSISAPRILRVDPDELQEAWNDYVSRTERTGETSELSFDTSVKYKKVKIGSLIVKMLNRLIKEEVVPYEAISVITGPASIYVRILVSSTAIPIIMLRCERNGVGNVVGMCFVSPLEASMIPPALAGPKAKVVPSKLIDTPPATKAGMTPPASPNTHATSPTSQSFSFEELSSDESAISSDEGAVAAEEEETPKKRARPHQNLVKSANLFFLSPEQKGELKDNVEKARQEWLDTASQVRVAQVVEEVSDSASMTFDYIAFCNCAAMVAAIGLVTNSVVAVIASMLISPIMGPVMCFTFGTTVRQPWMISKGFRNEIYSLLICIGVGAIIGIFAPICNVPERQDWPSNEMVSRGQWNGLVSGLLIALPSGVAVALSTLGKNSSGMVGVAISLSLLPPAVNAGICWFYQLMLLSDKYNRNEGDDTRYWEIGLVSFLLTSINILCIWVAGVLTFELKEVAPLKKHNAFWTNDIAVYREKKDEGADLDVINEGIKAKLDLNAHAAANGEIYKDDADVEAPNDNEPTVTRPTMRRDNAVRRRRGTRMVPPQENIFLMSTREARGAIPEEIEFQGAAQGGTSLFENANKFGGIEGAGEALFEDT